MKILIVEDEEMAAKKLIKTLTSVEPGATVVGVTSSIWETVAWLRSNEPGQPDAPDLILMDIELADGQSFQIFNEIDVTCTVIFTTSYDEYAIKAFKVNSIDYLLKPVQADELQAALEKFHRLKAHYQSIRAEHPLSVEKLVQQIQQRLQPREYRQRFLVTYAHKLIAVDTQQIAYFFSDNKMNQFKTVDGRKIAIDYTLDELETMLNPSQFFRINRSFLVSVGSVDQIQPYFGNRLAVQLKPVIDKDVIVSREKLTPFKDWMGK
ncbi:LytTR family DNA-binding domain-containing protein [Spirosoma sp. RP8]|uniref:LytTR family DNA-binding domain-containing protein n=1 Tax=Spirosoma liriopis TaxID=2937440 RepID=A0ABT0HKW2_9BACT|nr:LytTR family DNA-binding domain-containing protein [Spirosoma liriopis]MCK8492812.1 LytTR family DNA-binding domain-containing protein [Spirosoma liriopis]